MRPNTLISGGSFAGLATAYLMNQLGYRVTVVEIAKYLKKGGTPVNIGDDVIDIVTRMGLSEKIEANRIHMQPPDIRSSDDASHGPPQFSPSDSKVDWEIERDTLLEMMYDIVKDDAEFLFGNSIESLEETADKVTVTLADGQKRDCDLVFGCDGIHSRVRRLHFGDEAQFMHFLGQYFSITIVPRLLIPEYTTQLWNEAGRFVMLNTYNGKTDIVLCFASEQEIPYDYRNEAQQRKIIADRFTGLGWKIPLLLQEVESSQSFYFDKVCQIKMPSWTRGRVALVGDAAYCASPAAGMGGSLAIIGAGALADALQKHPENFQQAFKNYNESFRPYVAEVQANAQKNIHVLMPAT